MKLFILMILSPFCAILETTAVSRVSSSAHTRRNPPAVRPTENFEEMQRYINSRVKENAPDLDSYISAYNHEKHQSNENRKLEKSRVRRFAPELIKFEISDAKEPDEITKEFMNRIRERKTLEIETLKIQQPKAEEKSDENVEDEKPLDDSDLRASGSKRIHVYLAQGKRINSELKMPAGVRKAIENAFQKKSLYKVPPSKRYASSLDMNKFSYGNLEPYYGELPYKLDNNLYNAALTLDFAKQLPYIPAPFPIHAHEYQQPQLPEQQLPSQESQPIHASNQLQALHYTEQESLPVAHKGGLEAQKVEEEKPATISHSYNLPSGGQKIQISHGNLGNYNIFEGAEKPAAKYQSPVYSSAMSQVLTELISKTPTEQLRGLSQLLANDHESYEHQVPLHSTAPILFPSNPQPIAAAHTHSKDNEYLPQNGHTEAPKDFTPITEHQEDVTQKPLLHFVTVNPNHSQLVHVTPKPTEYVPPPISYKDVQMSLSPNYEEVEHHQYHTNEKKYGSRYAFGYKIRDFHTGNNFGHSENRDDDGTTRGQYHTLLPDGRVQNVQYHVDDSGYHADVTYQSAH